MTLRIPLLWLTLLFAIGILIGKTLPSEHYILATGLSLPFVWYTLRAKSNFHGPLLALSWILLGASRMSMPEIHLSILDHIHNMGICGNRYFVTQLQTAGLKDQALALVSSLILGNKTMLSPDIKSEFSLAGASHLLALSGMHLSILYGLIHFLILKRLRYTSKRTIALPVAFILIWGYALLTGFPSSLVRASLMLTFFTITIFSPRHQNFAMDSFQWETALHALAMSALIMLILDPTCMWEIGWQLSYSAMLAIILFNPQWRIDKERKAAKFLNWILGILGISLVAQIGTMPLVAYYFHTITPLSIFLNLFLIPFTMLIIYCSLPLLVYPISWLAGGIAALLETECSFIRQWIALPGTSIQNIYPSAWETAWIYFAWLLLAASRKMNHRYI